MAVFLDINPAVVERVTFRLDGAMRVFQVDPSAPFDLGGTTNGTGRARLLDAARRLGRGSHTQVAEVTSHDGTRGVAGPETGCVTGPRPARHQSGR